jgi:sugar-specific transcriptional regulator TrmB
MLTQNEEVQTLVKLGLTVLQARVYIALVKFGASTGKTTAKAAQVAPQDVYRVLGELQEKGLVEKIIFKPPLYRAATTIQEGISMLLKEKQEEYIRTKKQAEIIFNSLGQNKSQNNQEEGVQFTITSELKLLIKSHEKLTASCKNSIDFIFPIKISEKELFRDADHLKAAIKRGIKIRAMTGKPIQDSTNVNSKSIFKSPEFEHRFLPESAIPFGMHIFDNQEATLAISSNAMPSLWTNNSHVVKLAQVYFEHIWKDAEITNQ